MLPWQYQCVSNVMVDIFDTAHGFTNRSLDKQKVKPRKFVADNLRDGSSYFFNSRPSITIKKRSEPSNELHKELDSKDDVLVRRIRENLPVSIGGKGGFGGVGAISIIASKSYAYRSVIETSTAAKRCATSYIHVRKLSEV